MGPLRRSVIVGVVMIDGIAVRRQVGLVAIGDAGFLASPVGLAVEDELAGDRLQSADG
jgi:hypothetical protein